MHSYINLRLQNELHICFLLASVALKVSKKGLINRPYFLKSKVNKFLVLSSQIIVIR